MHLAPREVQQPRTDDGASRGAAQGTAAFGQLYREHFDGLYDFVARIVRDRDLAGEIVQSTFAKAWDELREGRELQHPKAWLYAVARNHALDELRRRRRLTDDPELYAQADPSRLADPQAVAEANEMVELVWSSAAALNPDEYSLLDLHVRHGFGAADLADALDLERGAVYTRLSRLRSSLEDSVVSTLLVRRGSKDCQELACIIAEHDGGVTVTPQLRRAVRTHVKDCEICKEARKRVASPVALFGALAPIVPLAGMREGIIGAILPSGSHAAAGAGVAGGAAVAARQGSKVRYIAAGAGGIAAAAAIATIALSSGPSVHDPAKASSLDHAVGVASADNTIAMSWAPGKNAKGYSVVFSRNRATEPPARENVTGTQYTSSPLAPGRWWFILRSHGKDGSWTDTLRVGPFVITAPVARVTKPKPSPKPRTKRAVHRRRAVPHPAATPAPATPGAQIVADVRAGPSPQSPKRKPASPKVAPKKKKKSSPPRVTPPPATTPAPTQTPPTTTTPPAAQPPTTTPVTPTPVTTPPPVNPGGGDNGDGDQGDQGGGDHGEQGGGHGGGDHGHGHGG